MQSKFLVMLSDKSRDQQGFSSLGGANLGFDEAERKENIRNLINNEIEKNNVQISAKSVCCMISNNAVVFRLYLNN